MTVKPNPKGAGVEETLKEKIEKLLDEHEVCWAYMFDDDTNLQPVFPDALEALVSQAVAQARKEERELIKSKMVLRKPTHGICCTCQICGGDKDDCYCYNNGQAVTKYLSSLSVQDTEEDDK